MRRLLDFAGWLVVSLVLLQVLMAWGVFEVEDLASTLKESVECYDSENY